MNNMKTITLKSTGAALEVNIGFLPSKVEIVNASNGCKADWSSGMATGEFIKTTLSATTLETTNGIAHTSQGVAGVAQTASKGITLGAAADINDAVGEDLIVHAWE